MLATLLLFSCSKIDAPAPDNTANAKVNNSTTVLDRIEFEAREPGPGNHVIKGVRQGNTYANHRLQTRTFDNFFRPATSQEIYEYIQTENRIRITKGSGAGSTTSDYYMAPNGRIVYCMDSSIYPSRKLLSKTVYTYRGVMNTGYIKTIGSGSSYSITRKEIQILSPWIETHKTTITAYLDGNAISEYQTMITYKEDAPFEINGYDENMELREKIVYDPTIKDPEFNISTAPSFELITNQIAKDRSRGGIPLAGSYKHEGKFVLIHRVYGMYGWNYYSSYRSNVNTNEEGFPVSYREFIVENSDGYPVSNYLTYKTI